MLLRLYVDYQLGVKIMTNGIYGYMDTLKNEIVYIGKDSYIDKDRRHKEHLNPSKYNKQPINRVLQNNKERYQYARIIEGDFDEQLLNGLEIQYIEALNPIFNFTKGGDGCSGRIVSDETRKKLSEANKGKKFSVEHRRKLSEACKGKYVGEKNPMYGVHRYGVNSPNYKHIPTIMKAGVFNNKKR